MSYAIRIHELGGPEVLRWEKVETPTPAAGEVLVRHTAVGVNFIDTYHRSGLYKLPHLPHGLGVEAAGVVEAVGEGVDVAVGTRVGYFVGPGSYAEFRAVPAERVLELPDGISDEVAAAGLVKGMTAAFLLHDTFEVKPGQTILLHAAAGGVGSIAVQWAKHLGATVIGTCGSDEKAERVLALGADHAIVYTREDFVERTIELTDGQGVDVVYDSVGKATFHKGLGVLKQRGMMVGYGNASGPPEPLDVLELARGGSLYVTRPTLFDYAGTRDRLELCATRFFDAVAAGHIGVDVHHRFALRDAADAHRALESRATVGSIILKAN